MRTYDLSMEFWVHILILVCIWVICIFMSNILKSTVLTGTCITVQNRDVYSGEHNLCYILLIEKRIISQYITDK